MTIEWSAQQTAANHNPYADWFGGPGKPFSVTEREPVTAGNGFKHVFHVADPTPEAPEPETLLLPQALEHAYTGGTKIVCPLRETSVSTEGKSSAVGVEIASDASADIPSDLEVLVAVIDDGMNFGNDRFCDLPSPPFFPQALGGGGGGFGVWGKKGAPPLYPPTAPFRGWPPTPLFWVSPLLWRQPLPPPLCGAGVGRATR